ncbi:TIGR04255 family protein [Micromonospora sp. NPDC127501]|uniref:TIGR04255 family protein n=1 Tax=Micromonospora sp. NPDC127501 TaxID=3154872 RepID=UPI00333353D4
MPAQTPQPASPYDDEAIEEVPLASAPLVRVLAQVRHPALLVLSNEEEGTEAAMRVGSRIAKQFPIFESGHESSVLITQEGIKEKKADSSWIWRLRSGDDAWQVTFTRNFVALETSRYRGRTDFLERLSQVLTAYGKEIDPPSVSRVGFRYTNRISDTSHIDMLPELVRPELLGPAGAPLPENATLTHAFGQSQFVTDWGGSLLNWGLLPPNGVFDPTITPTANKSWILDLDLFNSQRRPFDASSLVLTANNLAGRAYTHFRWAVTSKFLEVFGEAE